MFLNTIAIYCLLFILCIVYSLSYIFSFLSLATSVCSSQGTMSSHMIPCLVETEQMTMSGHVRYEREKISNYNTTYKGIYKGNQRNKTNKKKIINAQSKIIVVAQIGVGW